MNLKVGWLATIAIVHLSAMSVLAADTAGRLPYVTSDIGCEGPHMMASFVFTPTYWDRERVPRQPPLPYVDIVVFGPESQSALTIELDAGLADRGGPAPSWSAESAIHHATGEKSHLSPIYAVIPASREFLPGTLRLDRFVAGLALKGTVEMCPADTPCSTASFDTPWHFSKPPRCE